MPSVVAERLREKFSRIRPRFGQTFPVVPSRLNHPYPAEGAGVRAPGQAVASPSGRSVAEWSVLRSFSFLDPFPSLPDPGGSLPFFFRPREGREDPPDLGGILACTCIANACTRTIIRAHNANAVNLAHALARTLAGAHAHTHAHAHTRPPPPRTRAPLRWIVRAPNHYTRKADHGKGARGKGAGGARGGEGDPLGREKRPQTERFRTSNGTNRTIPHPFQVPASRALA